MQGETSEKCPMSAKVQWIHKINYYKNIQKFRKHPKYFMKIICYSHNACACIYCIEEFDIPYIKD